VTSRFRFISAHRAIFGVKRLCRVLAVSRSGFYRWIAGEPARQARAADEDALAAQITQVHADSGGAYGSPRVTAELRHQGVRGQPQARRADHAPTRRGGPAPSPPQTHHHPGSRRPAGAGPDRPGLHRRRSRSAVVRRHHLPARRDRLAVSGHGHRHRHPPAGRLVGQHPHAHRPGHRRPRRRRSPPAAAGSTG